MKSYEHIEACKALQEHKLDSAILQQEDGSWIMSLMNSNKEISVVELPEVSFVDMFRDEVPDKYCPKCGCCIEHEGQKQGPYLCHEVCTECGQFLGSCTCSFNAPIIDGVCGEYDDTTDDDFDCGDPDCPQCGEDNK